jgi:C1A family cysteine protease
MALETIGELRASLIKAQATWAPREDLPDDAKIPEYSLGIPEGFPKVDELKAVDLKKVLTSPPANPMLAEARARVGLLPKTQQKLLDETTRKNVAGTLKLTPAQLPGRPAVVDWRNRWGTSWVDGVRDQNPCNNCWAFAVTGVIESVVRIDHCVWSVRSEGDLRDGWGKTCADGAWPQDALDWIKQHGIADPRCYPFYNFNHAYNPTPDRSGRTTKIDGWTWLLTTDQQKDWLYSVGPITCVFEVYTDFGGFGSSVYRKHAGATYRGLHSVEVIGYDDTLSCWICKNSWGTAWGDHGYFKIGYGECKIDVYGKIGVHYTDPDPVTKRRLHNGNLLESGYGATYHRNFEMVATAGVNEAKHWWRDNSTGGFPWHAGPLFAHDVAVCPTLTETSYNRNLEIVYLTTAHRLHHWWRDENTGIWHDGGVFGPIDAVGVPGFIQGSYNAPGNFEVVVKTHDNRLNHWWRDGGGWHDGGRFGSNIALSGASLVQSTYGVNGNLEVVAVLNTGQMQHFWRDDDHGFIWHPGAIFGHGVGSPPCMIQGQYGMNSEFAMGNFELCVAVGGHVQHWWRNNSGGGGWAQSATFGHDVAAVAGLLEGGFGFNLEVIVLRYDRKLQHYWRDGAGWHEGVVIGAA